MGDATLAELCEQVLDINLGLTRGEVVLIVTDKNKLDIAQAFSDACSKLTDEVRLMQMPVASVNGQEPPDEIAAAMLEADVIIMPLSKSLSWTKARMSATEKGARVASLPQINHDIAMRTFAADYLSIRKRVNRIADRLDAGDTVHITTALGTDLSIAISGRKAHGRKGGIFAEHGHWGNLPCGEAFIAPVEGQTNGVYVVDASQAGIDEIDSPIECVVEDGYVTSISGRRAAQALNDMLQSVNSPSAFAIGEFGIGCNEAAQICGITLEDEKVLGTCHVALGNNLYFGGQIDVPIHVDGVIKAPKIRIDGEVLTIQDAHE